MRPDGRSDFRSLCKRPYHCLVPRPRRAGLSGASGKGEAPSTRKNKCNQLLANCAIYSTAVDITATSNTLAAEAIPPTRSIWPR
jgi:hypothetical protein